MKKILTYVGDKSFLRLFMVFIALMALNTIQSNLYAQTSWKAPADSNTNKNPYQGNEKATLAGKNLYKTYCAICHGNKGKGDGVAGMALKPRPANFTKSEIQNQSDGALFWKITEGNAPMAAYKETLSEEQRWQLVNFIRTLKK